MWCVTFVSQGTVCARQHEYPMQFPDPCLYRRYFVDANLERDVTCHVVPIREEELAPSVCKSYLLIFRNTLVPHC